MNVSADFLEQLIESLERLAAQAREATGTTPVADVILDALVRHLRAIARTADGELADWRLVLLSKALSREHGVTLGSGNIGYHLRRLAITPDGRDTSVDRLINGLTVVAVEERFRADAERVQVAEQADRNVSRTEAELAAELDELERRAVEAENFAGQLQPRIAELEAELADEERRAEFFRGFVPADVADAEEAKAKPRKPSDRKIPVDGQPNIYQRGERFQARRPDGKTKTFDDLPAAVSYRDSPDPAESSTTPRRAGPSDDSVGSSPAEEPVAA